MTVSGNSIKAGNEIVSEFLKSIEIGDEIDTHTLELVLELFAAGSLTHIRVLQGLAEIRASQVEIEAISPDEANDD